MHPATFVLIAALIGFFGYLVSYILKRRQGGRGVERIVRCDAGHLFTTTWPTGALAAGGERSLRCPIGDHASLCRPIDPKTLSSAELRRAQSRHDSPQA